METRYLDADLLIIGGGSAGCMAAIKALELQPDLKVVIFEKGDIKYSGCIARGMDALNVVAIPHFTSPELYLEAVRATCDGVVNEPASYEMACRSFDLLKKLENWGVYFPLDKNGKYHTLQVHRKGKFLTCMEEPDLKLIVSGKAIEKGARVINRVMGLRLLMDSGRAAGAIGLNVRSGELVVCRADTVILSAGGTARFSLPNSGHLYGTFDYPGNTGDSYNMAFLAGAGLTGMEYTFSNILIKDANIPLLAIAVTRGAQVMDIFDNIIMEWNLDKIGDMDKAQDEERSPLRIKMSHLRSETIDEIEHILFTTERPVQERFFKGRGVDFRKDDIELWPTECQLCGGHGMSGIIVNEKAESEIPGLYAAGDASCVPKQFLTGAFVFGEVAAEQAVKFISSQTAAKLDDGHVLAIENQRNNRYGSVDKNIDVRELEFKVRRLISDYVISPKNEVKLMNWIKWSEIFKKEIDNDVVVSNGHELSKLYEIEHIVRCATLSAFAALERKESRWGASHRRTDYPAKDDANWLRHITLHTEKESGNINVGTMPITRMKKGGSTS